MQANRRYRFASDRGAGPCSSVSVSPSSWFRYSHPLAVLAAKRCRSAGHPSAGQRGVVACGSCWEQVIRADERFVSECGLPDEVTADVVGVDEIAVERACAGDRSVVLTRYEVWAAVAVLQGRGLSAGQIAARLHRETTTVRRVLAGLAAGAAA